MREVIWIFFLFPDFTTLFCSDFSVIQHYPYMIYLIFPLMFSP